MKIEGHGQAKILTQEEIKLLFNEGLQTPRDRTLFGVCLYTACRVASACSLEVIDIYTAKGNVRPTINFRKYNTKGKLQTHTSPVIEDLRSLLTAWKPNIGKTYSNRARRRRTQGAGHSQLPLVSNQSELIDDRFGSLTTTNTSQSC